MERLNKEKQELRTEEKKENIFSLQIFKNSTIVIALKMTVHSAFRS
jgi:hypothetical protein